MSVSVASKESSGAAKRGASGCITSLGVTFCCTDAAPAADDEYATAVTRTSPTNSGRLKTARPTPFVSGTAAFQRASGLKRREGAGLTRPRRSSPKPPPVLTPLILRGSPSQMGMRRAKRSQMGV